MNALDIIAKKRDGLALSKEEITWFITEYTAGRLPDYQASAWLMAVYLKGMTREEVVNLTLAMAHSGEVLDLRDVVGGFVIDKHPSGGVGDKTSLVVIPLVAVCGVPVAKMSGRGLGHTGGTLDKLESIDGFKIELDQDEFRRIAKTHKVVLGGQSANLAPADKALYALRDVTATVASMPLIASSIMSKKLAAGADGIVLDVKVGKGAFMATVEEARQLAQMMVNIGTDAGKKMVALLSDMNQPLGKAAGLALEVREAIDVLHNGGPADFREHCLVTAAHMLRIAGKGNMKETRAMAELALIDRSAFAKFREMVGAQGGNVKQIDEPDLLPTANLMEEVSATQRGFVGEVNAMAVGQAVLELGGGRLKKTDPIDHAVGVLTHVKVGDAVTEGQTVFTIHGNSMAKIEAAKARLLAGLKISDEPTPRLPLFYDVVEG